jgi:YesN/AraC family two-component response regulator
MDSPKILLVDDESDVTDLLKDYLELKGYKEIETAATGQEAINIITHKKPDFVILDIQLADDIDGMEVLKKTRELSPETKVVMVSAYKKEFLAAAMELGAVGFISKPIKMAELNETIALISKLSA